MTIFNVEINGVESAMLAAGYPMSTGSIAAYNRPSESYYADKVYDPVTQKVYGTVNRRTYEVIGSVPKAITKLANAKIGSGHDCFLKGITVSFDIQYPVYWSPQFQRYHFADIVSSSSAMHKLTSLKLSEHFDTYTYDIDQNIVKIVQSMIDAYNEAGKLEEMYDNVNISRYRAEDGKITYVPYGYNDNDNNDAKYDTCDSDEDDMCENGEFIGNVNRNELFKSIIANCPQGLMKVMRVTTNALQLKSIINQRSHHKLTEWREFCKWAKELYFWRYLGMYLPADSSKSVVDEKMDTFDNLFSLWLQNERYCKVVELENGKETFVAAQKDEPNKYELNDMLRTAYKKCAMFDRGYMYVDDIFNKHTMLTLMGNNVISLARNVDELVGEINARNQDVTKLRTFITDFIIGNKTAEEVMKSLAELDGEKSFKCEDLPNLCD